MKKPKEINELLSVFGLKMINFSLYTESLTHKSFSNENNIDYDYERLEILGDAIVQKIVTEYFFVNYPHYSESDITNVRKIIVSGRSMSLAAEKINLIDYAFLGNGIDRTSTTEVYKIKSNLFESFIGAIYISEGEKKCSEIIEQTLLKYYFNNEISDTDYKSKIQEIFQAREYKRGRSKTNTIQYKILNHVPPFKAELFFNDVKFGEGLGRTKNEAEQQAAYEALKKYYQK